MSKALKIILFSCLLVLALLLIKYKPAYIVEVAGKRIGYISNKDAIDQTISEYVNNKEDNIAFITANSLPTYEFKFISSDTKTSEEEVLLAVKDQSVVTYHTFAIKLDGETKDQVKTIEEAEAVVNQLKEEYQNDLELDLTIEEIYTEDNPNEVLVATEVATADIGGVIGQRVAEKKSAEAAEAKRIAAQKAAEAERTQKEDSLNGVTFTKPLSVGSISSRFGERSSIRSTAHTGLDIYAPSGTPIRPVSAGTVTSAGSHGSYGNLIIISHGNGVESYYGHCSAIYVSVGQSVDTSTVIGAVGSTGNSTGNHLHLEIRKDGTPLNPQRFLYN